MWRHSGSSHPKFPSAKIRWKISHLDFWDQDGNFLIDYLLKDQPINAEYYLSLLVQLKDILKENLREKVTKGVLIYTTMFLLTGHLQPQRIWPTWASIILITHPILRIWPLQNTTCSLD